MFALPASIKLTEDQQTKVNDIRQNIFRDMQQGGAARPSQEDMQKMRDLRQQLQQAAQAGDDAKVQEVQTQLDAMPMGQRRKQMQDSFDKQIADVLTSDQNRQYAQWQKLRDAGLPPPLVDNPQALKDAVLKLPNLSDVQKSSVEASYERYDRGATHADDATKATLADQFASEVVLVLKPAQKVVLSANARGPGGGPGGRGGRGPRGGGNGGGGNNAAPGGAGNGAAAGDAGAAPSAPPAPAAGN
jgi:hypothetical protein